MFCYQCEQTDKGVACTSDKGVCGKTDETAILQDVLMKVAQSISLYAHPLRGKDFRDDELDKFVMEALFTTVTNVNFDPATIATMINHGVKLKNRTKEIYLQKFDQDINDPRRFSSQSFSFISNLDTLKSEGEEFSINSRIQNIGQDLAGLEELITYGLKGMAAYADHALVLSAKDEEVMAFIHEVLHFLSYDHTADEMLEMALRVGEINLKVMAMLSDTHVGHYGVPTPTPVNVNPIKGKCILVSGHDLKDLELLLEQTKDKGINIYTHGEMLPAHGYPNLKKYPHLVGNYGGAWQDQRSEFRDFPGAILMTTNCIQEPREEYKPRIFTSGMVQWPNVQHISDGNFSPVIESALKAPGFTEDQPKHEITVGFGHQAVLGVADKVVEAVKSGAIKHFFLIGGCDGAKSGRNYYTHFAEKVPDDCVILTLACGKYRFNKMDFGTIGGIPRLLDIGQCNDAYSAIQIAVALAGAFNTDVNSLPLSMIISWYEQKAVAVLLTLLHLGIKNIHLGPALPAFVSPNVLGILVEKFGIRANGKVEDDMAFCLSK